ncbi:MAG: biotin--[acetyl-CoA-carboxylase] ligase [Eubacteriales bacterium]|nr:biotin--[acetyl-CoA-carboxylase] ligase [Eubacteriales bacterium]
MDKKQQIVQRLTETDGFVSGQELCRMLGVSRTAVWKNIQKLKEEGYPIEAVTNRGYRLLSMQETDVFNREQIAGKLRTAWAGRPIVFTEETGSTNDDIFALAAQGYPHGTLAIASRQTSGKGRRGRSWISPPEGNIYMSILLKPDLRPDVTPMLTVVMALSVYQASLEQLTDIKEPAPGTGTAQHTCRFGIKWPNDIVVSLEDGPYRKLCGILTEMRMEDNEISAITIGVGLNVNQTKLDPEIAQNATSYALALGKKVNRAALTASIWNHFEENYNIFTQTEDFVNLRPAYEAGLVNLGRHVHVLDPKSPFTGIAAGINERGELLVQPDEQGEKPSGASGSPIAGTAPAGAGLFIDPERPLIAVGSGEVSVRGVNGYV